MNDGSNSTFPLYAKGYNLKKMDPLHFKRGSSHENTDN